MGRRLKLKGRQVAAIDPIVETEERARAKYLRVRNLPAPKPTATKEPKK
jgi:hypothetical protein